MRAATKKMRQVLMCGNNMGRRRISPILSFAVSLLPDCLFTLDYDIVISANHPLLLL